MMHSSHNLDRNTNEDHVLQQTEVTEVEKVPMLRGLCLLEKDRKKNKASAGQSGQLGAVVHRKPKECWDLYFCYCHI